jgi:hypothetical protein
MVTEKREWWEWVLIVLLIAMLSLATYDCLAQSPSQNWRIVNEELLSDTCEFMVEDEATTIIDGQEIVIDKRMLGKELVLVTWSNGTDTLYSIREIYKKEIYKDIKHILYEFDNLMDILKSHPEAFDCVINEYLKIKWYEEKYY